MRKKVGELYKDTYPKNTIIHESQGRMDFGVAHYDATTLLRIHDQVRVRKSDHQKTELEVLKRSALILAVTAWESFIEDTVTEQLDKLLKSTSDPAAIPSIFNNIAHEWLEQARSGNKKPPDLILWTADNRKNLVHQSLLRNLNSFHTPNSANTARMFKRYLDVDIVKKWAWKGVSPDEAQKQLDALIKLRGRIVHKGRTIRTYFPRPKDVPREDVQRRSVVKALNLVYNLVDATDRVLGIAPTGTPFSF
jgi:RiboL-PSP-HEPN